MNIERIHNHLVMIDLNQPIKHTIQRANIKTLFMIHTSTRLSSNKFIHNKVTGK